MAVTIDWLLIVGPDVLFSESPGSLATRNDEWMTTAGIWLVPIVSGLLEGLITR